MKVSLPRADAADHHVSSTLTLTPYTRICVKDGGGADEDNPFTVHPNLTLTPHTRIQGNARVLGVRVQGTGDAPNQDKDVERDGDKDATGRSAECTLVVHVIKSLYVLYNSCDDCTIVVHYTMVVTNISLLYRAGNTKLGGC